MLCWDGALFSAGCIKGLESISKPAIAAVLGLFLSILFA
jgi:hypothetical protein